MKQKFDARCLVGQQLGLETVKACLRRGFRHCGFRGGDHVVSTNEGTFLVDLVLRSVRRA